MLEIANFNLQAFAVGCKYSRSFSVSSREGVIADYVLGEQGADKSPVPDDYYEKVALGGGSLEMLNEEKTRQFTATPDQMVVGAKCAKMKESVKDVGEVVEIGRHLMMGTMSLIEHPTCIFLGMVWTFAEADFEASERFKHPVAESLQRRLTKFALGAKEHPAEVMLRVKFRKKIPEGWLMDKKNDYLNVILTVRDSPPEKIWEGASDATYPDDTKVATVSIDVQRIFDPRRRLDGKLFETHLKTAQSFLDSRVAEILEGVGFGKD